MCAARRSDGIAVAYSGYVIVLDEESRSEWLLDRREWSEAYGENWQFTDALSAPDWKPKAVELCFLSFGGQQLDFVALARRGTQKGLSAKYIVRFSQALD